MIDALAQFKQGKGIEVQKSAEELAKDNEYNEPLKVSFQEQKSKLAESLYGSFKPQKLVETPKLGQNNDGTLDSSSIKDVVEQEEQADNGDEKSSDISLQDQEVKQSGYDTSNTDNEGKKEAKEQEVADLSKFKEDPNYPILERFTKIHSSTQLNNEELLQISKVLERNNGDSDPMEYLKSNIGDIDFKNPNNSNYLSNYIDKLIDLNKDNKDASKELSETNDSKGEEKLALPKDFKEHNPLNDENSDIVQMLIKNHTKLPDVNGKPNFDKDILTTCEVTANKLINGKIIPRNESFEMAMNDAKTGDLETRIGALNYINTIVNTTEGVKSLSDYNEYDGEDNIDFIEELDGEIANLNEQLLDAQNKGDNTKIKEIQEQIAIIEKDKSTGEVFQGGKFDKVSDNEPKIFDNV